MARIKKQVVTAPEESELAEIAKEVANAMSQLKGFEADMEAKIAKIRATYQDKILKAKAIISDGTDKLEVYALENRDKFEKVKSRDVVHGKIGFRMSTPAVKLARGLSKKIVGIAKAAGFEQFIRIKEELDKEKIIASRQDKDTMSKLDAIGITVAQGESFYFDAKEEEVSNV